MYGEFAYVQTIVAIFSGSKSLFELGLHKAISGKTPFIRSHKVKRPALKHRQQRALSG